METLTPTVQAKDVAPSHSVDPAPALEPLDSPLEPSRAVETSDSYQNTHQNINSRTLTAATWSSRQPTLSPTTPASRTAIADINATSSTSLEVEALTEAEGAPSILTSSVTTSAKKASSVTSITSSSPRSPSGEGDNSSHGPLPQWAYFYDPALTHAQVRYIESQMRPQDEYEKIPPDQRQSVVVKDLQQALSSMRLVYSRSTNVANSNPDGMKHDTASPRTTTTDATSQSADKPAQGFSVKDAILAGRSGSNMVTQIPVSAEVQRSNMTWTDSRRETSAPLTPNSPSQTANQDAAALQTVETEGTPVGAITHSTQSKMATMGPFSKLPMDASPRKHRSQPVLDSARLEGINIHEKRAVSGEEVAPKRRRLGSTLVTDEHGRASGVSTPYVSRPADSLLSPELPLQTAPTQRPAALSYSELLTESHPPPPISLETSPPPDVISDDDTENPRAPSGTSRGRKWPEEHVALLAEALSNGQPWETIMQVRCSDCILRS